MQLPSLFKAVTVGIIFFVLAEAELLLRCWLTTHKLFSNALSVLYRSHRGSYFGGEEGSEVNECGTYNF